VTPDGTIRRLAQMELCPCFAAAANRTRRLQGAGGWLAGTALLRFAWAGERNPTATSVLRVKRVLAVRSRADDLGAARMDGASGLSGQYSGARLPVVSVSFLFHPSGREER